MERSWRRLERTARHLRSDPHEDMAKNTKQTLLTGFTPTWTCILGNKLGLCCGKAPYLNDGGVKGQPVL